MWMTEVACKQNLSTYIYFSLSNFHSFSNTQKCVLLHYYGPLLMTRWDRTMKTNVLAEETLHDLMPGYCSGMCNFSRISLIVTVWRGYSLV